ncbi:MAG: hypothetical protein J6Q73_00325 [Bacteroidaceae bacterium]|nr:hypothetical protein [Bacteroidaceae bacterium]
MKDKKHDRNQTSRTPVEKKNFFAPVTEKCGALVEKIGNSAGEHRFSVLKNLFAILFFVIVWALLAFRESALLFRVNELSVFLYDNLFYEEMMSMPAGILYYAASWLVQFFYYPVLGATIYVALLAVVYWLTYRVFDIPPGRRYLAMLPVVALLASNTQLGYWIFYIKIPGYYYVALLGVLLSLLVAWLVKVSNVYLRPFIVVTWVYFAYPCLGVYAIVSGVIMGLHALCRAIGGRLGVTRIVVTSLTMVVAAVAAYLVPPAYYHRYTTVPLEDMHKVALPVSQWKSEYVPDNEVKAREVAVVSDVNGRVGYPVKKALTKFKINIDGSFSQKAINTAKNDLYAGTDINRPVDGKKYTFTFVGKDGTEYYINAVGEGVAVVEKQKDAFVPKTGHFVCVANPKDKNVTAFKTSDGKFLVWNKELVDSVEIYTVGLASSLSGGNAYCVVVKMLKEDGVQVADNSELFGLVNLLVLDGAASAPLFVPGLSGGEVAGSSSALFNDAHSSAMRIDEVGFKPQPLSLEMQERSMWYNVNIYWIPFWVLLLSFVLLAVMPVVPQCKCGKYQPLLQCAFWLFAVMLLVGFSYLFWYSNVNFRIENKQNRAMWNEEWEEVAELARKTDEPTRQVVMNKNIALLKLGRLGNEMFTFPEGSADIEASIPVRLAQTGGKMAYYLYGKFNFCYRWCVEDAVEYGWRIEYLKHAVRSMLLSGEYGLAQRYINILKRTKFYADWACEMEKYVQHPESISRNRDFSMPLSMTCYEDFLDVDESYVEAYLTKNLTNSTDAMSRTYVEAALGSALTRKDAKSFWFFISYYVNELKMNTLPKHYQEAVLLFVNVDKGRTVQVPQAFLDKFISVSTNSKMKKFMQRVSQYKGMSEEEMAPYFKDEFGDTYFYFYFFVRNIKTN